MLALQDLVSIELSTLIEDVIEISADQLSKAKGRLGHVGTISIAKGTVGGEPERRSDPL